MVFAQIYGNNVLVKNVVAVNHHTFVVCFVGTVKAYAVKTALNIIAYNPQSMDAVVAVALADGEETVTASDFR